VPPRKTSGRPASGTSDWVMELLLAVTDDRP
jgi:hypothetical protein